MLPLHLHPSAMDPTLSQGADLSDVSCVFRVHYDVLRRMSKTAVRDIFKRRHILVTNCPLVDDWVFNEECLGELGPLHQFIPVQGKH